MIKDRMSDMWSGALFSPCGLYRYRLHRRLGPMGGGNLLWVMLNPSTADDEQDDPTIRKCIGFTKRLGSYSLMTVVNLYAYRSTDPDELLRTSDAICPENDAVIGREIACAASVIVAWGAHKAAGPRVNRFLEIAGPNQRLFCLGRSKSGAPRHPLRLPYSTELEAWS